MNLAGFYEESISNGEGVRAVVFVSGCPHHCKGCHNEEAQDFDYGEYFNKDKIINSILENTFLKGVTISGGEPLCKENIPQVLDFLKEIKAQNSSLNLWCYTGYTLEQLVAKNDIYINEVLGVVDVLVDGPYIESLKNPRLKFRGSENQRILNLKDIINTGG